MSGDEEEAFTASYLRNKRRYIRSEATRINSRIDAELQSLSPEERYRLVASIEKVRTEVENINEKIFKCLFREKSCPELTQFEYDSCVEYDGILTASLHKLYQRVQLVHCPLAVNLFAHHYDYLTYSCPDMNIVKARI